VPLSFPYTLWEPSTGTSGQNFYIIRIHFSLIVLSLDVDRLCGLVVKVPGYRSRGPGSTAGTTRFSEKEWVWNGANSAP
jgi:hypothetical protein